MYLGFFKPIERNKHEYLERASSSLLCSVVSISHILLSLHELYKSPHLCSLSPTFILFDLFLKRKICCWMSHTFCGIHSGCLLTVGIDIHCGKEAFKETGNRIHQGMGLSYYARSVLWIYIWNEGETSLEGSAASFVWYLFTFSGVAMHLRLVLHLVWVLFSTLRKAVMLRAQCMTESLKPSKVSHFKRKNGGYALCSLTA